VARRALDDRAFAAAAADAKVEGVDEETIVRRALLSGFPDRLARRRAPGSPRVVLASGHGGVLDRESVVLEGEFLLALDVEAGARGPGAEARVRLASRVERTWLPATTRRVEQRFDPVTGAVRAFEVERVSDLAIAERAVPADPGEALPLLVDAFVARGVTPDQAPIAARLRFAGIELDLHAIGLAACAGRTTLPALNVAASIVHHAARELSRLAPESLPLPSSLFPCAMNLWPARTPPPLNGAYDWRRTIPGSLLWNNWRIILRKCWRQNEGGAGHERI